MLHDNKNSLLGSFTHQHFLKSNQGSSAWSPMNTSTDKSPLWVCNRGSPEDRDHCIACIKDVHCVEQQQFLGKRANVSAHRNEH